jgi:hypothetical protein
MFNGGGMLSRRSRVSMFPENMPTPLRGEGMPPIIALLAQLYSE